MASRSVTVKPLQIQIGRAGYMIGKKQLRTVTALETELIRRGTKAAHLVPADNVSYFKVRAALQVIQRCGIFVGFTGNAQGQL